MNLSNVKPRRRQRLLTVDADASERHASWLELFFDLVFVLAVAQLARILAGSADLDGFVKYLVLFVPVWWSWMGFTFYADRFESEETEYRVLMFAGMLAVAALSLTLGGAFTRTGDTAFIVCYVLVLMVLIIQYARTAYLVPLARPFSVQYAAGFCIAVAILLAALFVDPPVRYYLWAVAFVIELITPFINLKRSWIIPFDHSHIPERFGLFTIIVLGEAVIATANGAADVPWNIATIGTAALGFAMGACIWWINFEFVEDDAIRSSSLGSRFIYICGHFFIVASIVALGIGVEHAIKGVGEPHLHLPTLVLLGGSIAVYLSAILVIRLASGVCRLLFIRGGAIAVALLLIYAGQFLPPQAIVGAFLLILVAGVWLEGRDTGEEPKEVVHQIVPCEHSELATVFKPRSENACEECIKNNYKWVHLRLCMGCGHVGCCDSSVHKHATKHFHKEGHPIIASLEEAENWAWCYEDQRFVPLVRKVVNI